MRRRNVLWPALSSRPGNAHSLTDPNALNAAHFEFLLGADSNNASFESLIPSLAFAVKSSEIPKNPLNAVPRLIDRTRWGADPTIARPARETHATVKRRCQIGSSMYELANEVSGFRNS